MVEAAVRDTGVLEEELADFGFAPTVTADSLDMFRAQHKDGFWHQADAVRPQRGEAVGNCLEHSAGGARLVFANAVRGFAAEEREGALILAESGFDMQRIPGAFLFIFGDTEREFARIAEGRHVDAGGLGSANLKQDQLQRTAQSAIGAADVAEQILTGMEAELVAYRTVDDDERRSEMSGGLQAVGVEPFITDGAGEWDQDAHHLWRAARHDRVGGDLFDGCQAEAGRHPGDYFVGIVGNRVEHPAHSIFCRRNHREGVAKRPEAIFIGVLVVNVEARGLGSTAGVEIERRGGFNVSWYFEVTG